MQALGGLGLRRSRRVRNRVGFGLPKENRKQIFDPPILVIYPQVSVEGETLSIASVDHIGTVLYEFYSLEDSNLMHHYRSMDDLDPPRLLDGGKILDCFTRSDESKICLKELRTGRTTYCILQCCTEDVKVYYCRGEIEPVKGSKAFQVLVRSNVTVGDISSR